MTAKQIEAGWRGTVTLPVEVRTTWADRMLVGHSGVECDVSGRRYNLNTEVGVWRPEGMTPEAMLREALTVWERGASNAPRDSIEQDVAVAIAGTLRALLEAMARAQVSA